MYFTETAETAAVRISVMRRPSSERDQPAGLWIEQQDAGLVGRQAACLVGADYGYEFGAQDRGLPHKSGHGGEEGGVSHFHDGAYGLHDLPAENAASAASMAPIRSAMGSTARMSASLRQSVIGSPPS